MYFSQLASLVGTVLLGISFIISGRFKWVEDLFGGLDKMYKVHHVTGGVAFVMLLHHPLFLIVDVLPDISFASKYFWFSNLLPYNFGIMALYTMLILLALTFLINLPYNLWAKTHEYMGVVLLLACVHILTITSDVSRYFPLKFWVVLWLMASMVAVVYKRILYRYFGPKYKYIVEKVGVLDEVVEIWLKPKGEAMSYYPGQFVFSVFEKLGSESHPFSIASNGFDGRIRLDIKILGDYTLKAKQIVVGDTADVYGPYGKFFESLVGKKELVFIAGGIGVTPFLGMLDLAKKWNRQKITMIYCAKTEPEMIFDKEIADKVKQSEQITYFRYCSDEKGRITAESILKMAGGGDDKKFLLCGPTSMMESLTEQLADAGVKRRNIIFEDFNFK